MAIPCPLYMFFSLLASSLLASSNSKFAVADDSMIPQFAFSWLDDKNKFQAGEIASVNIRVFGDLGSNRNVFMPTLTVNGKTGNSSFISGVSLYLSGDPSTWKIFFTPITIGVFNLIIDDEAFKVLDSSLHFEVEPGKLYPSVCVASWMGLANEFEAGANASILVLPRDAFGNNISSTRQDIDLSGFSLSVLHENGSIASIPNITRIERNKFGYIIVECILVNSGGFLLLVEKENQTLNGAPLPFEVNPGPLDVSNCEAKWKFELTSWQIFSQMEIFLHQRDRYGNLVPGEYEFDADVVEKSMNLSIPITDLQFEYIQPGVQLFSFRMSEPGNFLLMISEAKHHKSISNMPYEYSVYVGYCDGSLSVVNGSGVNDSNAGNNAEFSVYLKDAYGYPATIELERLQVQIVREVDSTYVIPNIHPRVINNGSGYKEEPSSGMIHPIEPAPASSIAHIINARNHPQDLRNPGVHASIFDITYNPKRSGNYSISVLCGNIVLNEGHPIKKEVKASEVNVSVSGLTKFDSKAPKHIRNEIMVLLMDTFYNPVPGQSERLKLEMVSANSSGLTTWKFEDNADGTYNGSYLAMEAGIYQMCVSLDGNGEISPCPFEVHIYSSGYFPKAYDDEITVWEDESVAFDPLENDYLAGGNASMMQFSMPVYGSLLQQGRIVRYTPYKDFSGSDFFQYTISDVNGNLATATVNISILTAPPQFVSSPTDLQAVEDLISPRFGGFPGLEIRYSDQSENISVRLSAVSGTIFLSPMLMQFREPMWSGLSISNTGKDSKALILEGHLEAINVALQSIQYLGDENFAGVDALQIHTKNKNGINKLDVPLFLEPINDPPYIHVPDFILLESIGDESLIYDKARDKFEFSVGDPDFPDFPGGEPYFPVKFSVEVSGGILRTSLPAELINSTELNFRNVHHWQPLQTYVAISKHFTVRATGIRFQGTLKDCNDVMQQLVLHGGENGVVLTVKVSDMGNYGTYPPNITERTSQPLHAEARVSLIRQIPLNSFAAHTMGTAIVLESIAVFCFGLLLLFFSCKCAFVLVNEKRRERVVRNSELSTAQTVPKPSVNADASVDTTHFTECFFASFLRRHFTKNKEPSKGLPSASVRLSGEGSQQKQQISVMPLEIEKAGN